MSCHPLPVTTSTWPVRAPGAHLVFTGKASPSIQTVRVIEEKISGATQPAGLM